MRGEAKAQQTLSITNADHFSECITHCGLDCLSCYPALKFSQLFWHDLGYLTNKIKLASLYALLPSNWGELTDKKYCYDPTTLLRA